ncbi:hypothetical protein AAVH_22603 [Aphelenchoides avenae]|nr:hypothetical protein AAVH_22603 [Aphelenchus avenae]
MASQGKILGMDPTTASRIFGGVGIVLGLLTILAGFFVATDFGIFVDGIVMSITYAILLFVGRATGMGIYIAFIVVNGILLLGKAIYFLILLVSITGNRYGYGYGGYGYPGMPGMYHSSSSIIPGSVGGGYRSGGLGGLFGWGDGGHYGGYNGVYGANGMNGMYGYEYYHTRIIIMMVMLAITFVFIAVAEFVVIRAWQISKQNNDFLETSLPSSSPKPGILKYPVYSSPLPDPNNLYINPPMRLTPGMPDPINPSSTII